jgi:hypothetical protein
MMLDSFVSIQCANAAPVNFSLAQSRNIGFFFVIKQPPLDLAFAIAMIGGALMSFTSTTKSRA